MKTEGGNHSLRIQKSEQMYSIVYSFCIKNSEYQHEYVLKRLSRKKKRVVFAKRLSYSKRRLFKRYDNRFKIGKRSFYNIIRRIGEFKNPKKRTDLCDICMAAKQAKKMINERINIINDSIENNQDIIDNIDCFDDLSDVINKLMSSTQSFWLKLILLSKTVN